MCLELELKLLALVAADLPDLHLIVPVNEVPLARGRSQRVKVKS